MLYVTHIDTMKKCEKQEKAAGLRPICIWRAANKDNPSIPNNCGHAYILQHEELPPQYGLFVFCHKSLPDAAE